MRDRDRVRERQRVTETERDGEKEKKQGGDCNSIRKINIYTDDKTIGIIAVNVPIIVVHL